MINRLSIRNKKLVIILVIIAIAIPLVFFVIASAYNQNNVDIPTISPTQKPPLPTFPDAPRVEGELTIQYAQGQEFHNLSAVRQKEIMEFLEQNGVTSQEKVFEATEGELAAYYLLKFRQGINIESVAQKIYELPEIMGAQPNYEVGLF